MLGEKREIAVGLERYVLRSLRRSGGFLCSTEDSRGPLGNRAIRNLTLAHAGMYSSSPNLLEVRSRKQTIEGNVPLILFCE